MLAKVLVSTEGMSYSDWLDYRRRGIGGSDASVICGINRYKSPVELWMEKTNQLQVQESGEAAYWGTQLEPFVRAEFTSPGRVYQAYRNRGQQAQRDSPEYGTLLHVSQSGRHM